METSRQNSTHRCPGGCPTPYAVLFEKYSWVFLNFYFKSSTNFLIIFLFYTKNTPGDFFIIFMNFIIVALCSFLFSKALFSRKQTPFAKKITCALLNCYHFLSQNFLIFYHFASFHFPYLWPSLSSFCIALVLSLHI